MLEGILQGLMQWIYGLFLDLMSYCANALLGVMSTNLEFFEENVPIVPALYGIFVAIGWGLLIGNCAFQSMKAMFAGFGFETESPVFLLLRTALFGTLLIFSRDICEIGLSLGKKVIDLLGIPTSVQLMFPTITMFSGFGSSWLLVIIIGFILGFQLIKLFFEIAERYAVVAVLTMLCPVGLAFGGSKSTKDICSGFMRMYASMIVMMVMNVLFLKLVLSAFSVLPQGIMLLPWCLLIVGITKTAKKADQLISKIGLNPAITGDPLGAGHGLALVAMAARTVMHTSGKGGKTEMFGKESSAKSGFHGNTSGHRNGAALGGKPPKGRKNGKPGENKNAKKTLGGNVPRTSTGSQTVAKKQTGNTINSGTTDAANVHHSSRHYGGNTGSTVHTSKGSTNIRGNHAGGNQAGGSHVGNSNVGGINVGGNHTVAGAVYVASADSSVSAPRNSHSNQVGGSKIADSTQTASTTRFGANSYAGGNQSASSHSGRSQFNSSGKAQVNTNRFGSQPGMAQPSGDPNSGSKPGNGSPGSIQTKVSNPATAHQQNVANTQPRQSGQRAAKNTSSTVAAGNTTAKTGGKNRRSEASVGDAQKPFVSTASQQPRRSAAQMAVGNAKKTRFGSSASVGGVRQNTNSVGTGDKFAIPPVGMIRTTPGTTKNSAHADVVEKTDTVKEVIQTAGAVPVAKDGEDNG